MTQPSYVCGHCGRVSYHPHDIRERYCAACDRWDDDLRPPSIYPQTDPQVPPHGPAGDGKLPADPGSNPSALSGTPRA